MKSPTAPRTATHTLPETQTLEQILRQPLAKASPPPERAEGIIIGRLEALDEDGTPTVRIDSWGLRGLKAGTLAALDAGRLGQSVALGFEAGDPRRPLILGFLLSPETPATAPPLEARLDQKRVVLEAEQEIELRCGESAIILTADGRVTIRGTYVTSQASATQRILGGSVNLN